MMDLCIDPMQLLRELNLDIADEVQLPLIWRTSTDSQCQAMIYTRALHTIFRRRDCVWFEIRCLQ